MTKITLIYWWENKTQLAFNRDRDQICSQTNQRPVIAKFIVAWIFFRFLGLTFLGRLSRMKSRENKLFRKFSLEFLSVLPLIPAPPWVFSSEKGSEEVIKHSRQFNKKILLRPCSVLIPFDKCIASFASLCVSLNSETRCTIIKATCASTIRLKLVHSVSTVELFFIPPVAIACPSLQVPRRKVFFMVAEWEQKLF